MMELLILAQLQLFHITGPDGQAIEINPDAVVMMRPPRGSDHFSVGTNCLVFTVDGKFIGVIETCPSVQQILKGQIPTSPTPPIPHENKEQGK